MDDATIGPSCHDDECTKPGIIAGWCPGHAIARYRRFVLREEPRDDERGRWSQ